MPGALRALVLLLLASSAFAQATFPLINRYNSIAATTYQLHLCGALTPERRDWLRHLRGLAMRPFDWNELQWADHDEKITDDFRRLYPSVTKEKCAELVKMIDDEQKNVIRSN